MKAGPYPIITTPDSFEEYVNSQKKDFIVELTGPIIPLADLMVGARTFGVDLKKKKFEPTGEAKTRIKRIKNFREKDITTFSVSINCAPKNSGAVVPPEGEYQENTDVMFRAVPSLSYVFSKWTGDTSGEVNPVTILIDSDKKFTAHFKKG